MTAETHELHAVNAARWAESAMRGLNKAAQQLASVGVAVADEIRRKDERPYLLALSNIEDAWQTTTQEALLELGRAREQLILAIQAEDESRRQKAEAQR